MTFPLLYGRGYIRYNGFDFVKMPKILAMQSGFFFLQRSRNKHKNHHPALTCGYMMAWAAYDLLKSAGTHRRQWGGHQGNWECACIYTNPHSSAGAPRNVCGHIQKLSVGSCKYALICTDAGGHTENLVDTMQYHHSLLLVPGKSINTEPVMHSCNRPVSHSSARQSSWQDMGRYHHSSGR